MNMDGPLLCSGFILPGPLSITVAADLARDVLGEPDFRAWHEWAYPAPGSIVIVLEFRSFPGYPDFDVFGLRGAREGLEALFPG